MGDCQPELQSRYCFRSTRARSTRLARRAGIKAPNPPAASSDGPAAANAAASMVSIPYTNADRTQATAAAARVPSISPAEPFGRDLRHEYNAGTLGRLSHPAVRLPVRGVELAGQSQPRASLREVAAGCSAC
jgi:hypothetical protein